MKNVRKQDLPAKTCPVCLRPFHWRKKWEKNWDMVRFCSDRCRLTAHRPKRNRTGDTPANPGIDS